MIKKYRFSYYFRSLCLCQPFMYSDLERVVAVFFHKNQWDQLWRMFTL